MELYNIVNLPKWFVILFACIIGCLLTSGIQGRPQFEINDNGASGQWIADGSLVINTGSIPLTGGSVILIMGPLGWKYERRDWSTHSATTAAKPEKLPLPYTTTTAKPRPSKPTTKQIITVPQVPMLCPPGFKPDNSNICREDWGEMREIPAKTMTARRT